MNDLNMDTLTFGNRIDDLAEFEEALVDMDSVELVTFAIEQGLDVDDYDSTEELIETLVWNKLFKK